MTDAKVKLQKVEEHRKKWLPGGDKTAIDKQHGRGATFSCAPQLSEA